MLLRDPLDALPGSELAQLLREWRGLILEGICSICIVALERHAGEACCACCRGTFAVAGDSVETGMCTEDLPRICSPMQADLLAWREAQEAAKDDDIAEGDG